MIFRDGSSVVVGPLLFCQTWSSLVVDVPRSSYTLPQTFMNKNYPLSISPIYAESALFP